MNAKVTKFYEAVSADDALQEEFAQVTDSVDVTGVSEAEAREAVAMAVAAFAVAHDGAVQRTGHARTLEHIGRRGDDLFDAVSAAIHGADGGHPRE